MRSLDEALEDVGDFGYFQKRLYCFLLITATFPVMHRAMWDFTTITPVHRCKLSSEVRASKGSTTQRFTTSTNLTEINELSTRVDSCKMYDTNNTNEVLDWNEETKMNRSVRCSAWIYYSNNTGLVNEFDLVCNRKSFVPLGSDIFTWAEILGYFLWGILADRLGRKKILFGCLAMQAFSGFLGAMVTSLSGVIAMRAALGLFSPGCFVGAILRMEFVGPSMRMVAAMVDCSATSAGVLVITLAAYLISDWRHLQIIISIPGFLFLSCWWFVPESARWLLAVKKERDGRKIVSKIALKNRRDLTLDTGYESDEADPAILRQSNPINLCCFTATRTRVVFLSIMWLANGVAFFSLSYMWMPRLHENLLVHSLLNSLIEFPAYFMCLFTLNRFGRRFPVCVSMVATGVLIALLLVIPEDSEELKLSMIIFAKVSATATFASLYVFSMELQATVIRGAALGMNASCRVIGQVIVPWTFESSEVWKPLPFAIVATLCSLAGFLALILPETTGYLMPERLQDVENPRNDDDADESSFSGRRVSFHLRRQSTHADGKPVMKEPRIVETIIHD